VDVKLAAPAKEGKPKGILTIGRQGYAVDDENARIGSDVLQPRLR
jgi:hypothetical protein